MASLCFCIFPAFSRVTCCKSQSHESSSPKEAQRPSSPMGRHSQRFVILMRHGMTDWNYDGRIQGNLDLSRLNGTGIKQAKRVGKYLCNIPIEKVFCSPLHRARQTLSLVASVSQNPNLQNLRPEMLDALTEIEVPWQGGLRAEVSLGDFSESYAKYKLNPHSFSYLGFNPMNDLEKRARIVWDTIRRSEARFQLVVAHNQMNKALICTALGIKTSLKSWNQSNCCFNVFVLQKEGPPILRMCNGSALKASVYAPRRCLLRHGWTRIYLHHAGFVTGIRHELRRVTANHLYCINHKVSDVNLAAMGAKYLENKSSGISASGDDLFVIHKRCMEVFEEIVHNSIDQHIVIRVLNSEMYALFFTVCLSMNVSDVRRFHGDPGGLSIVDVQSEEAVGLDRTRVECFNTNANASSGPILGYTFRIGDRVEERDD